MDNYGTNDFIHVHPQQLRKGCCTLIWHKLFLQLTRTHYLPTCHCTLTRIHWMAGQITLFSDCTQVTIPFRFTVQTNKQDRKRTERTSDRPQKGGARSVQRQNNQSAQRTVRTQSILFMCKRKELLCVSFYTPHGVLAGNQAAQPASSPAEGSPVAAAVVI